MTPALPEELLGSLRFPFVLINVLEAENDEEDPNLILQKIGLTILVEHPGEILGEGTLVGANQPATGSSRNRGLLEIEDLVLSVVSKLNQETTDIEIQVVGKGAAAATMIKDMFVTFREYTLDAWYVRSTA